MRRLPQRAGPRADSRRERPLSSIRSLCYSPDRTAGWQWTRRDGRGRDRGM